MATALKIALITTSTRTPRIGPNVSKFVRETLEQKADVSGTVITGVEVYDFNLPIYNESILPAMVPAQGSFEHEHSKRWSAEIAKYDAYIFVIPEYNYGLPAATKNAVDYLYNEWINKPVLIISYGIHGGKSSSDSLKGSLNGMKLRVAETRPALAFAGGPGPDMFEAVGKGTIGEATLKSWEEVKPEIVKGFEELRALAAST